MEQSPLPQRFEALLYFSNSFHLTPCTEPSSLAVTCQVWRLAVSAPDSSFREFWWRLHGLVSKPGPGQRLKQSANIQLPNTGVKLGEALLQHQNKSQKMCLSPQSREYLCVHNCLHSFPTQNVVRMIRPQCLCQCLLGVFILVPVIKSS